MAEFDAHAIADQWLADNPDTVLDPSVVHNIIERESHGEQSARSPKGALGPMQLMPGTARDLGVDPNDPVQNIHGGLTYLDQLTREFGPRAGAAAYFTGPGNVRKNLAAGGDGIPNTSDGISTTRQYVDAVTAGLPREEEEPQAGPADQVVTPSAAKKGLTRPVKGPPKEDTSGWVDLGFDDQPPAAAKSKPGFISDVAKVGASGLTQLAGAVGRGLEYAGGKAGSPGTVELGQSVQDYWREATQKLIASTSPATAQALSNPILNEDFSLGDTPIASAFWGALQAAPAMFATGGLGKALVGTVFKGLTAVAASTRLAGLLTKLGMAPEAATAMGARVATAAGTGTAYGVPAGVIFGLQGSAAIEEHINAMPLDELAQSPAFQTEYAKTANTLPDQRRGELARESIARQAADEYLPYSMALNGSLVALTGGGIFGKWNRGGFEGGMVRRGLTGAALDQATLQPMMLGQQLIENAATREYANPDQSLTTGMPAAFASGLSFAPFGMVGGIAHPRAAGAGARPAVEPEQTARARAVPPEPGEEPPPGAPPTDAVTQARENLTTAVQANDRGAIDKAKAELAQAQQAGAEGTQEGDIGRQKDGLPFASRIAAISALKRGDLANTHEIVGLAPNAFVLRPKAEPEAKAKEPETYGFPSSRTREDFNKDAIYQGVNAATDEENPSYWFTDQPQEAAQFATAGRGVGEQAAPAKTEPRIDIAYRSDLPPEKELAPSGRPSGSNHVYTGEEGKQWRKVIASIPVEAAEDPHRYLVEEALKRGEPLPARVLADYPDLAAKYKAVAETPPAVTATAAPAKPARPAKPGLNKRTGEIVPERLPGMLPGDVTHSDGAPFLNKNTAQALLQKERLGGRYDAVKIGEEQWVLRPRTKVSPKVPAALGGREVGSRVSYGEGEATKDGTIEGLYGDQAFIVQPDDGGPKVHVPLAFAGEAKGLPPQTAAQVENPASKEQVLAGNAALDHRKLGPFDISMENRATTVRRDLHHEPPEWETVMKADYGYAKAIHGFDKEGLDFYIKPGTPEDVPDDYPAYVVDQRKGNGQFDEHKVMAGWKSAYAAKKAYLEHYEPGWEGLETITPTTIGELHEWAAAGGAKEGRFAEWKAKNAAGTAYVSPTQAAKDLSAKLPSGWEVKVQGGDYVLHAPNGEAVYEFPRDKVAQRENRIEREIDDWTKKQAGAAGTPAEQKEEAVRRARAQFENLGKSGYHTGKTEEQINELKRALFHRALAGVRGDDRMMRETAEEVRLAMNAGLTEEGKEAAPKQAAAYEIPQAAREKLLEVASGLGPYFSTHNVTDEARRVANRILDGRADIDALWKKYAKYEEQGLVQGGPVQPRTASPENRAISHAVRLIVGAQGERAAAEPAPKKRSEAQLARDEELRNIAKGRKAVHPETDSIVTAITKLGGLKMSERMDITRDTKGSNPRLPFIGALFSNSPRALGLDEMVQRLAQRGYDYLTPQETEDVDGGVQRVRDMIDDELNGRPHYSLRYDRGAAAEAFEHHVTEDTITPAQERDAGVTNLSPASQELARAVGDEEVDAIAAGPAVIHDTDWSKLSQADRDAELNDIFGKADNEVQRHPRDETGEALAAGEEAGPRGGPTPGEGAAGEHARPGRAAEPEALALAGETNAEVLAREERERAAAEAKAKADAEAEAKAKAQREPFVMTGSTRPADELAARGQTDIFSTSEATAARTPIPEGVPTTEIPGPAEGEVRSGKYVGHPRSIINEPVYFADTTRNGERLISTSFSSEEEARERLDKRVKDYDKRAATERMRTPVDTRGLHTLEAGARVIRDGEEGTVTKVDASGVYVDWDKHGLGLTPFGSEAAKGIEVAPKQPAPAAGGWPELKILDKEHDTERGYEWLKANIEKAPKLLQSAIRASVERMAEGGKITMGSDVKSGRTDATELARYISQIAAHVAEGGFSPEGFKATVSKDGDNRKLTTPYGDFELDRKTQHAVWMTTYSLPEKAKPGPPTKAQRKAAEERAALEDHFTPGNIIKDHYWKEYDRVLEFRHDDPRNVGQWGVKVEKVVKRDGEWVATEAPRWHSTYPDKRDEIVERAPQPAAAETKPAERAPEPAKSETTPASGETEADRLEREADELRDKYVRNGSWSGEGARAAQDEWKGMLRRVRELRQGEEEQAYEADKAEEDKKRAETKYDFVDAFPIPNDAEMRRAGRQGLLDQKEEPGQSDQEFLKQQHEAWADELQGYDGARQVAEEALKTGVDPANGKKPRNLLDFNKRMKAEKANAEQMIEGMLGEYENHFGEEAAKAFRDHVLGAGGEHEQEPLLKPYTTEDILEREQRGEIPTPKEKVKEIQTGQKPASVERRAEQAREIAERTGKPPAGRVNHEYDEANRAWAEHVKEKVAAEGPATPVEQKPIAKTIYTLSDHPPIRKRIATGNISADELKMHFDRLRASENSIKYELMSKKLAELAPNGARGQTKAQIVDQIYRNMLSRYHVGQGFTYQPLHESYEVALAKQVHAQTDADIQAAAQRRKDRIEAARKAMDNPETLDEFRQFVSAKGEEALTPEQKAKFDDLQAQQTREWKDAAKERSAKVEAPAAPVGASDVIETKHTKKGHDLFVVQLANRVEREAYNQLNAAARKMGGNYSSYKGGGAVPGFQFRTRDAAEAFRKLVTEGDTAAATEAVKERREDRSEQSESNAVARFRDMAAKMTEKADESLNADRLTNTAKRARQASSAEADARAQIQIADTLNHLADAIESGEAKHLSEIRHRTQVELLNTMVNNAKTEELRKRFKGEWSEMEKHRGEAPTIETAEHAQLPAYRSSSHDLASLALKMQEAGGLKQLGKRLQKEVLPQGNIAEIDPNFGVRLVEALDDYNKSHPSRFEQIDVPYYFSETRDRRKQLARMGITDDPTLRAALREFIEYRGGLKEADKAKELERGLVGREVGLDFFPTPRETVNRMIEAADLQPGMRVLEPSAGNGNIAEAIRAAGIEPDVNEISSALRQVLEAKGFKLLPGSGDFLEQKLISGQQPYYDRILMNPPFSNNQDIEHLQHAYDLLKPDGKLVAIMGEGAFFRGGKKETAFREWLEQHGAEVEKLPEGTFTDKRLLNTTGTNARLVVLDKAKGMTLESRIESPWRSELQELLPKAPFAKDGSIPSDQLARWLDARMREGKIKKEEYELSGLPDYLKLEPRLTRDQVQQFVEDNGVRVEEKMYGGRPNAMEAVRQLYVPRMRDAGASGAEANELFDEMVKWARDHGAYGEPSPGVDVEKKDKGFDYLLKAIRAGEITGNEIHDAVYEEQNAPGLQFGPRTHAYVHLPGGREPRELLLTLPSKALAPREILGRRWEVTNRDEAYEKTGTDIDEGDVAHVYPQAGNAYIIEPKDHKPNKYTVPLMDDTYYTDDLGQAEKKLAEFLRSEGRGRAGPEPLTELPPGYDVVHDAGADPRQRYVVTPPGQLSAAPYYGYHATAEAARRAALWNLNFNRTEQFERAQREEENRRHFIEPHWKVPDVVADVLFDERKDTSGKRVLHLNEIQSAWGQKGRKQGFAGELPSDLTVEKINDGYRAVRKDDPKFSVGGVWPTVREVAENLPGAHDQVPSGPFVRKTEAWVALALKRMIRYAAENGFDRISFSTGDQLAERYSMAKAVDSISWHPRPAEGDGVSVVQVNAKDGTVLRFAMRDGKIIPSDTSSGTHSEQLEGHALEDVVGKEIAKQMTAEPHGSIQGEGLKIGGQGMRAFYDRIVPQVANDVLRKLGGGKVGEVPFKTQEADGAWVTSTQPGFDITPALREKALQGMPLFSQGEELAPTARAPRFGKLDAVPTEDGRYAVEQEGGFGNYGVFRTRGEAEQKIAEITRHQMQQPGAPGLRERMPLFSQGEQGAPASRVHLDADIYHRANNRLAPAHIIERIRDRSTSEFNRELASRFLELGVTPKIVVPASDMPSRVGADGKQFVTRGQYNTGTDTVKIFTPAGAERTVLHEVAHAATIYAIERKTPAGVEMVKLYEQVRDSNQLDNNQYGMKDVHEFVAEGYSNPEFQTQLGMVEVKASGKVRKAWDALVDIARRILGLGPDRHSALEELLLIGSDVMHENAALRHDAALRKAGAETPARTFSLETEADHHEEPIHGAPGVKFDDLVGKAHEMFDAVAHGDRSVNWWRRTLGTPFDKAYAVDAHGRPKLPGYRRVYTSVQDFLRDQHMIATDAMDRAPDLLPRLANLSEVFKRGPAPDDVKRAASAIFDGTLVDKRVYTDGQLEAKGLSPKAIRYYRQARAAVDQSLDDHTASIASLLVEDLGIPKSVVRAGRDEPAQAGKIYGDAVLPLIKQAEERLNAARQNKERTLAEWDAEKAAGLKGLKGEELAQETRNIEEKRKNGVADLDRPIKQAERRLDNVNAVYGALLKQFGRAATLKREGYAPLMRFGEHTVYAYDPTTAEQHSFSAHDTQLAANREARALSERYPEAEIVQGIMSHDNEHLYEGVTPEALKIFAQRIAELPNMPEARAIHDALYQDYLKLVVSERSPLKRMIYRKGVPGYSEDLHRVLSAFVSSNARAASRNYHALEMKEGLANIPKQNGDVLKDAAKLVRYVMSPQEEAPAIRGLLFFNFIGGSVVSAINNLTQVPLLTTPHLLRYADTGKVSGALAFGAQVALGKVPGSQELRQALARAKKEGLLAPLEVHQLYAEQSPGTLTGRTGSLAYRKFIHLWGSLFQAAEQFNRRTTFAAAYKIAEGMSPAELRKARVQDAYHFAEHAVDETQFVYNKGNRPNWFRGPVGATLGTFKSFTVNTLEFLNRLPAKQKAIALSLLVVGSGMKGLPFAQDLEDVIDTLGQMLGYNTNTDRALHELAAQTLGDTAGDVFLRGVSAVPGFPGDFSNRIGFGRLVPGIAALKPSTKDRLKALADVLGPAGSQLQQGLDALTAAQEGRYGEAAMALAPKAVRQFGQGLQQAEKGYAEDARGRRTVDVSAPEAVAQMLGLTPYDVAKSNLASRHINQSVGFQRMTAASLIDQIAQARADRDQQEEQRLRGELADWNAKNPEARILLNAGQINARVRQIREDRATRLAKSAPKTMRADVRSQLP